MKKKQNKIIVFVILGLILISGISFVGSNRVVGKEPIFTLFLKTHNLYPETVEYANLIKQQLAVLGIDVQVTIFDWYEASFPILIYAGNTDLGILRIESNSDYFDPDFSEVYAENGSINMSNYQTYIDWDEDLGTGKNEWYLKQGLEIMPPNSEERIQHYHEWEQYLMDELLILQPLFNDKSYRQSWNTLVGYNYSNGILGSWGNMYWSGQHIGQTNSSELVISDNAWSDLNPLSQIYWKDGYRPSKFISSLILDPLFWVDPNSFIKPHLVKDYSFLNDTHVRLFLREGLKWASDPQGNFTNEDFDAEDVYFTLYSWGELAYRTYNHHWIEDMEIIDKYTIDIYIDSDSSTPANEPHSSLFEDLLVGMIPEHYLNQTQESDGITPVTDHPSWDIFSTKAFGTGLFEFNSNSDENQTILTINPTSWWLNSTITNDPDLDWELRFGDFSNILQQLRIKTMLTKYMRGAFYSGEIDISQEFETKPMENIDYLTQAKRLPSMYYLFYSLRDYRFTGNGDSCEKDSSITKGLAVRKAISYTLNRKEMNDVVHGGEYYITDYPIYETFSIWCNPNIIRYDHDLEKARYYMNLAGYSGTTAIGFGYVDFIYFSFIVSIFIVIFKQKKRNGLKRIEK